MARLITPISSCAPRMTTGERRLAERLADKLDEDYLAWYDVPIGPHRTYPDFVILHPSRGVLILETKDWRLETIQRADPEHWDIIVNGVPKRVLSPMAQARHAAHAVVDALQRDPALRQPDGVHQGKLAMPWGYGVVFTRITRKQFTDAGLDRAITPEAVICSDEMTESTEPLDFQTRLWAMFPQRFATKLSLPQLDRVRWILFPEVRVQQVQGSFFDHVEPSAPGAPAAHGTELPALPDVMRVMDLQQEQLARSLGAGHRVIHGVAGSGKTMILGYRAEYLARSTAPGSAPILILCFNEPLAVSLAANFAARGLSHRVHARTFHSWCHQQLRTYGQQLPPDGPQFFDGLVDNVARGVERGHIPTGQYQAVLVDEGHDFTPEWLRLVVRMVDPSTNSLLVLYDDAQNIYERARTKSFSFKSVGIQAQGRTTILRINYRNTAQILRLAQRIAVGLLDDHETDEDGIPLLAPLGCGREGDEPLVLRAADLLTEAAIVADWLASAGRAGRPWSEMAVLGPDPGTLRACERALRKVGVPCHTRSKRGDFRPGEDAVKLLTMRVSKGLEFPMVAVPGVGQLPFHGEAEIDAARLVYVAATRATERLLVTVSGDGALARRLGV